jgi:arginine decarboxylase
MLATTLGVELDYDKSYDERKEQWRISGQIVRTMNISQTAVGDKKGHWTTVISACILLSPDA